jgi:hypothetical protein
MTNFQRVLAVAWLIVSFGGGLVFENETLLFKIFLFLATLIPFLLLFSMSAIHEMGKKISELENRICDLENKR